MLIYILIVITTVCILVALTGLYYFSKQKYDNFFVGLLLNKDTLKLLKANKVNEKKYKKLKVILNVSTIFLIVLAPTAIYVFKSDNIDLRYIIMILLFANAFISNKLIKKLFNKKEV